MKFYKISAQFQSDSIELAEELISHVFFSFNLTGVVCQVPIPEPDEGFGTATLTQPDTTAVIGYLPDSDAADLTLAKIRDRMSALTRFGIRVSLDVEMVDEEDWAHAWKAFFNVTRITDRIVVKPEWQPYTPKPSELVIRIDPGMAFGTGTHPTTAMCLALLEAYMTKGATLLDVGCGSGILMIGAGLMGAGPMAGIDTDPMAIAITRENLEKNQVPMPCITLTATTLDQTPETPFDIITANIISQVILGIMDQIKARLAPGGTAILSGIITEREPQILAALETNGLTLAQRQQEDDWVALAVQHRIPSGNIQ